MAAKYPCIDNHMQFPTPEGSNITFAPAGLATRAKAWFIDSVFQLGCTWLLLIIVSMFVTLIINRRISESFMGLCFFILSFGYNILCEAYWQGQTIGKRMVGLRVIHDDGTALSLGGAISRNLLRLLDSGTLLWIPSIISMSLSKHFKRPGDYIAGTIVVHTKPHNAHKKLIKHVNKSPLKSVAPPNNLSTTEEDFIIRFWEDRFYIPTIEANRIAEKAKFLVGQLKGDEARKHIYRVAQHLIISKA